MKQNIIGLTDNTVTDFLSSVNEPAYRLKQIKNGIYVHGYNSFKNFSNLPKILRNELEEKFIIRSLKKVDEIWQLSDGYKIESVVIYENKRVTFCISSQVGCPLDCKFCATGKMGILRNLSPGEIVEQVLEMTSEIGQSPTNIVYMGMGEPMLNYDVVKETIDFSNAQKKMDLANRRITVSTC